MSENEKLIEWARSGNHLATRPGLVLELAESLEAAGKALTPTEDERAIFDAIADRLGEHSQATNYEIADSGECETKLRGPVDVEVLAEWLLPTVLGFCRSEVPEPPTREAWRDSIVDERCQQPSKGYTADHDREHGLDHLLEWAQEYARIGESLKSAALIEAARDLHRAAEVPEPSAEKPSVEATHRGTFGHVWPCPLFYVGNWRRGEEAYHPTATCSNAAVCEPQGDPSDAMIDTVARAIYFRADEIGINDAVGQRQAEALARAALRAAGVGGVR